MSDERDVSGPTRATTLPTDAQERKKYPIATGVLDYFPDAIVAVSRVSFEGNQQHNPGQPLHWARGKSMDQDDTLLRHILERGKFDTDGQRHSAKAAWRALAILQLEIEADQRSASEKQPGEPAETTGGISAPVTPSNPHGLTREEQVHVDSDTGGLACNVPSRDGRYTCNRFRGHTGRHVAHPVVSSLDVWEDA